MRSSTFPERALERARALPPFFSDFSITPTEIVLGDDLVISFVIRNPNNQSITWLSTNRIGDITQIIEIELESYESKFIWYRIIPHIAREYDVWIDGQTGTFRVISTEIIITDPLEELNLKIDYLNTTIETIYTETAATLAKHSDVTTTLTTTIETVTEGIGKSITEVNEEIESLENKISSLQTTILFAYIAIAVTVIGGFYFIKRMR